MKRSKGGELGGEAPSNVGGKGGGEVGGAKKKVWGSVHIYKAKNKIKWHPLFFLEKKTYT